MTRDDVDEILESIDRTMASFDQSYERALVSLEVKQIDRPSVKACMEHIRSCFDYMAVAINVSVYGKKSSDRCHFPYGKSEAATARQIAKVFPDLEAKNVNLFLALRDAQSFTGATAGVLTTLFEICNQKKHVHLVQQARKDRFSISLPLLHAEAGAIVSLHGVIINGHLVNNFDFNESTTMEQVDQQLGNVPHINHLQKVEFRINGSEWDVRDLLKNSRDLVAVTRDAVFAEIA